VAQTAGSISEDTTICIGNSVPLFINGVVNATWSPPTFLDNPTSFTPISTPTSTVTYQVNGQTVDGCVISQDVTIIVFTEPPVPDLPDTLRYCSGGQIAVNVSGAQTFDWYPTSIVSPASGPNVIVNASTEQYIYCDFSNACATVTDSAWIDLIIAQVDGFGDTTVCPGEMVLLSASGAQFYVWTPSNVTPITTNFSEVSSTVAITTNFIVTGTDAFGCVDTATVLVETYPSPFVQTNPDIFAILGEVVQLDAVASGPGTFVWSPAEYLSCVVCQDPLAQPDQNFSYTVTFTDTNGCTASDVVRVKYDPLIYVPNAFTPDGNSINSEFFALGVNIDEFKMEVFNRWGELIYTGDAQSKSWDGTYKNLPCPDGVYVWKIYYSDLFTDDTFTIVGHVSLLR
jgi:gliding motility-associated-like protein